MPPAVRPPITADLRASPAAYPPGPAGARSQRPGTAARWPLFAGLGPLGALHTVPRLARTFTVLVLAGWQLGALADAGELVISELTTNAVRAAEGPDSQPGYIDGSWLPVVWLRLMSDRQRVRIEVWDNIPAAPGAIAARHARPDEESGRGLEIVENISEDWGWGWGQAAASGTKYVWATLAVP